MFHYLVIAPNGVSLHTDTIRDTVFRELPGWKALRKAIRGIDVGTKRTFENELRLSDTAVPLGTVMADRPVAGVMSLGCADRDRAIVSALLLSGQTPAWEYSYLQRWLGAVDQWSIYRTGERSSPWPLRVGARPFAIACVWPLADFVIDPGVNESHVTLTASPERSATFALRPGADAQQLRRFAYRQVLARELLHRSLPAMAQAFFPRVKGCLHREEFLAMARARR